MTQPEFIDPTGSQGGCLCGALRYEVRGEPIAATLCHCHSCRRASGGTNVAWAVFDRTNFEWLSGFPGVYSSSPGIEWLYCKHCGSLVGYRRSARPDHMDITTGTLDDPDRYPPAAEIWLEHKIAWEPLDPKLPKHRRSSSLNAD
jgi:hypothetical protein